VPRAQEDRLRDALEDYVSAHRGDGHGRTGHLGVPDHVKDAKALLDKVGGSQNVRGDSPGQRAAGSTGEGPPNFNPPANLPE